MTDWKWLIVGMAAVYAAFLTWEKQRAKHDRAAVGHVIHVNGTRGKSTVTRLIDAGLREGGFRTVCKSTGTLPFLFHTDGHEEEIKRLGPANVREQLSVLHTAAKEHADILIIECMALEPELQYITQNGMLCADVGVITNARIDHTDVMGETREEILDCMMNMLPKHGRIFTAERDLYPQMERRAKELGSQITLACAEEVDDAIDFPENVALALKVCESFGVRRETALQGMKNFIRDPYAMKVFQKETFTFVNAMSTNDVTSAKMVYEKAKETYGGELVVLINNREDRPARALEMVRLCKELQPKTIVVMGTQQQALVRRIRREVGNVELICCARAEEVPFSYPEKTLMLAVGNIKDEGIRLFERAEQELGEEDLSCTVKSSLPVS